MVDFTDETIEKIFGADDAENENSERLLEYFYKSEAYEQLTSNLAVRVLVAHKGVGKSALLKRAFLADEQEKKPALWLRPNDLGRVPIMGFRIMARADSLSSRGECDATSRIER